jgi:hypothetical protein
MGTHRTTQEYHDELLKVIQEKKIKKLDHAFGYTSFCAATAYNHKLEKMESIKEAIQNNKVRIKNTMLDKWIESDNATLQVAAFRLLSDSEEHQKLNQSYIDHTTKGKEVNLPSWLNDKHEEDTDEE